MITINLGWSNNSRPPHRQYLVKMETFLLEAICAQTSKATNPKFYDQKEALVTLV